MFALKSKPLRTERREIVNNKYFNYFRATNTCSAFRSVCGAKIAVLSRNTALESTSTETGAITGVEVSLKSDGHRKSAMQRVGAVY